MGLTCGSHCGYTSSVVKNELENVRILSIQNAIEHNYTVLLKLIRCQKKLKKYLAKQIEIKNSPDNFPKITKQDLKALLNKLPKKNNENEIEIEICFEKNYGAGIKYYGELEKKNKIRQGRGIQTWKYGKKYIGYFENDKACGKGKIFFENGDIYDGEMSNNEPNGKGIFINKNGEKYEGLFKNGKKDGKGKEKYNDGSKYIGYFKNDLKNGKGEFIWADGSKYNGEFKNNEINGKGKYISIDKKEYNGEWLNNKFHGLGTFTWPDGRKYIGEYKNDLKDGYGIFENIDGCIYKGFWKLGKQDGDGEFFSPRIMRWRKGVWKNGKKQLVFFFKGIF